MKGLMIVTAMLLLTACTTAANLPVLATTNFGGAPLNHGPQAGGGSE